MIVFPCKPRLVSASERQSVLDSWSIPLPRGCYDSVTAPQQSAQSAACRGRSRAEFLAWFGASCVPCLLSSNFRVALKRYQTASGGWCRNETGGNLVLGSEGAWTFRRGNLQGAFLPMGLAFDSEKAHLQKKPFSTGKDSSRQSAGATGGVVRHFA
jgi:hypothetical protein